MKKYRVLSAWPHSQIQNNCHVYTVFVFTAWKKFNERVAAMMPLHAQNVEERVESLEVET